MKRFSAPLIFFVLCIALFAFRSDKAVPYGVDKRPMPRGNDFKKLIPEKVGDFTRISFHNPSPDSDGDAKYRKPDSTEVFMLFGSGVSMDDVQSVFDIVCTEATNKDSLKPEQLVKKKDPSYILMHKPDGVDFFGWTRGYYYFSVESRKGKAVLDEFMKVFPY